MTYTGESLERNTRFMIRPALYDKLDKMIQKNCLLVSAPAGFGKSAQIKHWIESRGIRSVTVSLSESANDPIRFLNDFLDIFQHDEKTFPHSQSPRTLSVETATYRILHLLEDITEPFKIILEDYQEIQSSVVHESLNYIIDHLPDSVSTVVITRKDPPFSLASWRLNGTLSEVRGRDLRFSPSEIENYYREIHGLHLSQDNLAILEDYTEGWIGGMLLLAEPVKDRDGDLTFIKSLNKNYEDPIHHMMTLLIDSQPGDIQNFLLRTSILRRMNGPLCEILTGCRNGQEVLEHLEQNNLFVDSDDDCRNWFRYDHFLSEYLYNKLSVEFPEQLPYLHQKASLWYRDHGQYHEAVYHAFECSDFKSAETIILDLAPAMLKRGEFASLESWLDAFPVKWVINHLDLAIVKVWTLMLSDRLQQADDYLSRVEKNCEKDDGAVLYGKTYERFSAEKAIILAYKNLLKKDPYSAYHYFEMATKRYRGISRYFREGLDFHHGELQILRGQLGMGGRLRKAEELYLKMRVLWKHSGLGILGYGSVIMGELYYEKNQLDQVMYFVTRGIELGRRHDHIGVIISSYYTYLRLKCTWKNSDEIWPVFRDLKRTVEKETTRSVQWFPIIEAIEMRLLIPEGRQAKLQDWADRMRHRIEERPGIDDEFEYITYVRVLFALGEYQEGLLILDKMILRTIEKDRVGSLVEMHILQSLGNQKRGNFVLAYKSLNRALLRGEKEGYIRTFLDEGPVLANLLYQLLQQKLKQHNKSPVISYIRLLLTQFEQEFGMMYWSEPNQTLAEPLTQRELDILKHLADGDKNKAIAEQLGITIGTVKGYVVNIYGKLEVNNRTQAVAKSRELQIINKGKRW